jgi:hypothetical protein
MDLSEQSIHDVIHLTAAFSMVPDTDHSTNAGQAQEPRRAEATILPSGEKATALTE